MLEWSDESMLSSFMNCAITIFVPCVVSQVSNVHCVKLQDLVNIVR